MSITRLILQALLSRLLLHWTNRFIHLKSRELEISTNRNEDLQRETLVRWVKRGRAVQDGKRLAQSFADLRDQAQAKLILVEWRERALGKRMRRETLARVLQAKREATLREAWDDWRGRVIERRLAPLVSTSSAVYMARAGAVDQDWESVADQ